MLVSCGGNGVERDTCVLNAVRELAAGAGKQVLIALPACIPTSNPPPTEERVYRHRCVEAWAIVVPWAGFPLRKLLALVQPLPGAAYVRFETDASSYLPNIATPFNAPWPYVEGLTLQEAMNDLAFISIGQFNATLLAQSGAPIRLNVPWKYGFKSVKSIRKCVCGAWLLGCRTVLKHVCIALCTLIIAHQYLTPWVSSANKQDIPGQGSPCQLLECVLPSGVWILCKHQPQGVCVQLQQLAYLSGLINGGWVAADSTMREQLR